MMLGKDEFLGRLREFLLGRERRKEGTFVLSVPSILAQNCFAEASGNFSTNVPSSSQAHPAQSLIGMPRQQPPLTPSGPEGLDHDGIFMSSYSRNLSNLLEKGGSFSYNRT